MKIEELFEESLDAPMMDKSQVVVNIDEKQELIVDKPAVASPMVLKVVAFGANATLVAIQMIGNSLIMSSLGDDENAAAGLVNSIIGVLNGCAYGVLLTTGNLLGTALGKQEVDSEEVGAIIKTSWLVGTGLGITITGGYLSMHAILPLIEAPGTAKQAANFLSGFAVAAMPELFVCSNGLVIGQVDKSGMIPLLSMALYRLSALGFSYTLANNGYGAFGVGLGTGLGALLSAGVTQLWFSRANYAPFQLYNFSIPHYKNWIKTFFAEGWKLSLQRLSEWGNLACIVLLVGAWDNKALQVLQPALQSITLINLSTQGMSLAAMMYITRERKRQTEYYDNFQKYHLATDLEKFSELSKANQSIFIKNHLAGLLITGSLSAAIYFCRQPIIELFLGEDLDADENTLANEFIFLNLLGVFPDMVRIISGGILRGWGDILFPTLMSILCMTLIGVPAGAGISYARDEDTTYIFWLRIATMTLSALINCGSFVRHIRKDSQLYQEGVAILEGSPEEQEIVKFKPTTQHFGIFHPRYDGSDPVIKASTPRTYSCN